jgi:hypothetical protein
VTMTYCIGTRAWKSTVALVYEHVLGDNKMSWLSTIVRRLSDLSSPLATSTPKVSETRSSKKHDPLTEYECELIKNSGSHGRNYCCPDCGGELLRGPEGGMSINSACDKCHSEFNITILKWADTHVIGERISDKGPRSIGDRGWCYGLPNDPAPSAEPLRA